MDMDNISDVDMIDTSSTTTTIAEPFVTISHVTCGAVAILMNAVALGYITRLQMDHSTSFSVQMLFVCVNDLGSGLAMLSRALVTVRDDTTALLCVFPMMSVIAFDTVSKGNLMCICFQRYVFARQIKKTISTWQRSHTLTITFGNIVLGVLVALFLIPMFDITKGVYHKTVCNIGTVRNVGGANTFGILFFIQVIFIFGSDTLCLLAILKLKESANSIQPTGVSSTIPSGDASSCSGQAISVRRRAQKRQYHAITTILIILLVFNISYVPIIVVTVMNMAGQYVEPTEDFHGLIMLASITPCLVNPILIATRIHDVRNMIRKDIDKIKTATISLCSGQ